MGRYRDICEVIDDMAVLIASAQLRSGGMNGSAIIDELKAFAAAADWQEAVLNSVQNYAIQVEHYYLEYLEDYKAGVFNK